MFSISAPKRNVRIGNNDCDVADGHHCQLDYQCLHRAFGYARYLYPHFVKEPRFLVGTLSMSLGDYCEIRAICIKIVANFLVGLVIYFTQNEDL